MSKHTEYKAARIQALITEAQAAFEAGFPSEAARKRAMSNLSTAYGYQRDIAHDACINHANEHKLDGQARVDHFNAFDLPFDLHQFRDRHFTCLAFWGDDAAAQLVADLIELRAAMKAAPVGIAKAAPTALEAKEAQVRETVAEFMARRKADYLHALDIGHLFGGRLPVSVNAHTVWGHKGAVFTRHFYYLAGKFTALNVIMAAAQTLEDEANA
jgi:hypothetical protein